MSWQWWIKEADGKPVVEFPDGSVYEIANPESVDCEGSYGSLGPMLGRQIREAIQ